MCFDINKITSTYFADYQLLVEVIFKCVGKTGFEPATPWSQTRCATGLRYFPNFGLNRIFSTAVRAGFEPAVQFNPYGSLANY